jgi:uncharacterized protein YdhG (YjbR/CyaY superfamily)
MAPTKTAQPTKPRSTTRPPANGQPAKGFSDDEKAAMRARAQELKAEAAKADGEKELLAAIAKMEEPARSMAKQLHKLIKATAPGLAPKTWYGMPAYAKDGAVVCFFKNAGKFKARYSTLGFSDRANLDAGTMWPTEFALTTLTSADEAKIAALLKKAVR